MSQIRTTEQDVAHFDEMYRRVLDVYEALGYPASVVNSWAISPNDVPDLIKVAQRAHPDTILEVGTYVGVSTMILALACPEAKIVTVDPDLSLKTEMDVTGSSMAGVDPQTTTLSIARAAAEKLGVADRIQFVKGGFSVKDTFSTSLTSAGAATKVVGPKVCKDNGPFDFVFIDGLHTMAAVAADLKLASKHLSPGGAIALHDCVGFWGANVRGGIEEFLKDHAGFRFVHPPFADLWRTLGVVAPAGSKLLDPSDFSRPVSSEERSAALGETLSVMVHTVFGARPSLEVAIGAPVLPSDKQASVRILNGRTASNLNAELDRILGKFDKLENPVIFSSDLLDFAPANLVQNLLAAIAFRKGAMLLGVTPPGEAGVAGPESKPAAWLVDMAKANNLAAYAPSSIEFEPARYGLFAEERELGGNSRLATFVVIAPEGGFTDAKGRALIELTPSLATEREQAELQRTHVAAGFRRFFGESAAASRKLSEQNDRFQVLLKEALEAGQREKAWREENTESMSRQINAAQEAVQAERQRATQAHAEAAEKARLVDSLSAQLHDAIAAGQREKIWREENTESFSRQLDGVQKAAADERQRAEQLHVEAGEKSRKIAELSDQLREAMQAAHREKVWRDESAASHTQEVAGLRARFHALEIESVSTVEKLRASETREAVLKANAETTNSLNQLDAESSAIRERNLRKALEQFMDHERVASEAITRLETTSRERIMALEGEVSRLDSTLNGSRQQAASEISGMRDENARLAGQLREQQSFIDDYSQRLLDAYRAMDGFDALASAGEGALAGLGAGAFDAGSEEAHGLDASTTSAQLDRLRNRLHSIVEHLIASAGHRDQQIQQVTAQLSDYQAQIAERDAQLQQQLAVAAQKEDPVLVERIAVADRHIAETSLHLAEIYGVLEQLDQANLLQLRLTGETSPPVAASADPQAMLYALSERSKLLTDRLSHMTGSGPTHSPAFDARTNDAQVDHLNREVARLHREIEGILGSTSWRATGPIRRTGSVLSKVKRKAGVGSRLKAFTKAKKDLDTKLAPLGLIFPAFDAEAYTQADRSVALEKSFRHYVEFGEGEGRRPLPKFDPHFYLAMYPDVRTTRVSPLLHFMTYGVHEGRSPCAELHPLGHRAHAKGMSPLELFARS